MKDLPLKVLAGALVLMLFVSLVASERYFVLSDRPVVVHIAPLKPSPELADTLSALDAYGVHLPRQPSKIEAVMILGRVANGTQKPASFEGMSAPALGYSAREWSFLGMPFGFYTEYGHVLYVRNDWGTLYAPLNDKGLAMLVRANGRDLTKGYIYPYWKHLWGWLFVAGIALAVHLWLRRAARIREEQGLI